MTTVMVGRRHLLQAAAVAFLALLGAAWIYRAAISDALLTFGAGVLAWRLLAAQAGISRPGRRSLVSRLWAPLEAAVLAWLVLRVRGIGRARRESIPAEACLPIGTLRGVYFGRDDLAERPRPGSGAGPGETIPF